MNVLAISGSLRAESYNTALLRAAAEVAPEGVEIELFDGLAALPGYDPDRDDEQVAAAVQNLRERVAEADALLISTPEYNGSVPGQLKNAIDWTSRPHGPEAALHGKAVAVIGASPSDYGAMWAQQDLRRVLGIAGARVLEVDLPVGRVHERLGAAGELTDEDTVEQLSDVVATLFDHHQSFAAAA
jgi:chromate reductase, NAD(P)H dehydrogenase (quinone)